MKTKKISGKLNFQKTTVVKLDNQEKENVKGGYLWTNLDADCYTWDPVCPTKPLTVCLY